MAKFWAKNIFHNFLSDEISPRKIDFATGVSQKMNRKTINLRSRHEQGVPARRVMVSDAFVYFSFQHGVSVFPREKCPCFAVFPRKFSRILPFFQGLASPRKSSETFKACICFEYEKRKPHHRRLECF